MNRRPAHRDAASRDDDAAKTRESPFSEGDPVTILSGEKGPQSLTTVKRFLHGGRCMELADGSLWRCDGKRQWNFGASFYRGPVVEPRRPEDDELVGRRRAIGAIRKFADRLNAETPLSALALRRILDLINTELEAAVTPQEDDAADADGA